jgi:hypothetical protein
MEYNTREEDDKVLGNSQTCGTGGPTHAQWKNHKHEKQGHPEDKST